MKNIFRLVKVIRKCSVDEEKQKSQIIRDIILAALIGVAAYVLGTAVGMVYGKTLTIDSVLMTMFTAISLFITVMLSPALLNSMYLSEDLEAMLVLPLSPIEIVSARILALCPTAYLIGLCGVVPFSVGYLTTASADIHFYIAIILGALILPILTLLYVAVILMILLRLVKVLRNKNILMGVGIVLATALFLGYLYVVSKNMFNQEQMQAVIGSSVAISGGLAWIFPFGHFLASSVSSGFLDLLYFALILVGIVVLFYVATKKLYLPAALSMKEASSNSKKMNAEALKKTSAQSSLKKAFVKKELKMYLRNTSYLLNGIIFPALMPLVVCFSIFASGEMITLDQHSLTGPGQTLMFSMAMALGITLVSSGLTNVGTSSMSREGKSFWILKTLPMSWDEIARGKRNATAIIMELCTLPYILIGGIALVVLKILPIWGILPALAVNVLTVIALANIQMCIGIKKTNIHWEVETDILKPSTLCTIVFMITGFMIVPLGAFLTPIIPEWCTYIAALVFIAFILAMLFAGRAIMYARMTRKMEEIQC